MVGEIQASVVTQLPSALSLFGLFTPANVAELVKACDYDSKKVKEKNYILAAAV